MTLEAYHREDNAAVNDREDWLIMEWTGKKPWGCKVIESWPTRQQAEHFAKVLREHDMLESRIQHPTECMVIHRNDVTLRN